METSIVPKIYDPSIADAGVGHRNRSGPGDGREAGSEEGLLDRRFSGAALVGAMKLQKMRLPVRWWLPSSPTRATSI
jgi:hypothetical protein